jgi:hypothetical protein
VRDQEAELEAAMVCASARQSANSCEVQACFAHYLANTPPGDVAPLATQTLSSADQRCRATSQQRDNNNQGGEAKAAEERALQAARQCMVGAADCVVKSCYSGYLSQYGASGALRAIAQSDVSRAEQRCRGPISVTIVADGSYNAKSERGCGVAAQFGIRVAVKGGEISWEHQFRGISYRWVGAIDDTGAIRASVGNSTDFVADGRYSESGRQVLMHYPQCASDPITLSIIGRL